MKRIYLDNAATTMLCAEAFSAMKPYFFSKYGNASSLHSFGREAHEALEMARLSVAKSLNAGKDEVIFTSGGSESDNLAIISAALANKGRGKRIVTSAFEHHAVLSTCKYLETQGFSVTYVKPNKLGIVEPSSIEKAITTGTVLVSVMHANNEIGTIQPVAEIARLAHENGALFHTDAVQSVGKIPVDVKKLGIDLLSLSGHKFHGPKGVGALFVKNGTRIMPMMHGGNHERGLRAGTENVAGAAGMAAALEVEVKHMKKEMARQTALRDRLIRETLKIRGAWLNGHPRLRLPGNANFGFQYIEGEGMVLLLDSKGIAASTGSACSSHDLSPSHVLTSIGLKPEQAHGSLRLTMSRYTTKEEVDYVIRELPGVVQKLSRMSPLNAREMKHFKGVKESH
jgi:cysteine desulfurase